MGGGEMDGRKGEGWEGEREEKGGEEERERGRKGERQNEANSMYLLHCCLCSLPLNKWSRAF